METTHVITEAELLALHDRGEAVEVVNGQVIQGELMGEWHGWTGALILTKMGHYVIENKLGRVYISDTYFVLDGDPDEIRIMCKPDASFVAAKNVTVSMGLIFRAPDMAVEVISPSQPYNEMIEKVSEYLRYGTQEVWLVMISGQVQVFFEDRTSKIYVDDEISESRVVTGFKISLNEIFDAD